MPADFFEERLRAYLYRTSRRTGGPGAVDRVTAAAFEGPSRNQSRRLLATIAIALAAALAAAAPIAVLVLNPRHDNTPAPATRHSASPSPQATASPGATVSPGLVSGAAVSDFGLISATDGWVLTSNALFFTTDSGTRWANITPSNARPADGFGADGIKGVAFSDAQNGWVTIATSHDSPYSATVTLLHTSDQGQHWQSRGRVTVPLQYCLCSATVDAVDAMRVWLDIDVGTKADGWGRDILERSTDGGWTWHQVDIPTSGQLVFSDALHGVVAGGSPSIFDSRAGAHAVAPFYATRDGGQHWKPSAFTSSPPPTPSPNSPDPYTGYQTAAGLAIAYVQNVVNASSVFVYSSRDGSTWSPLASIAAGGLPVLEVISRSTWFLSDLVQNGTATRLRVTHDSGKTWQTLSPVPDPMPGNSSVSFAFADSNDGWAASGTSFCVSGKTQCGSADHLYATVDGGATWSVLSVPGPPPS